MSATRPVVLAHGSGVTRNIRTSGVFFEINADYAVGSKIIFAIEFDGSQDEKLERRSRGEIVRIEPRGDKVGVAVRIVAYKLESIPEEPQLI